LINDISPDGPDGKPTPGVLPLGLGEVERGEGQWRLIVFAIFSFNNNISLMAYVNSSRSPRGMYVYIHKAPCRRFRNDRDRPRPIGEEPVAAGPVAAGTPALAGKLRSQ